MSAEFGSDNAMQQQAAARRWMIIGRWQQYAGEARANLLRIAGVGGFYLIELINYYGLAVGPLELPATVDLRFHQLMTALTAAWILLALGTLVCLQLRFLPDWLKYATTLGDVALLTTVLMVADGPRSPLVVGYLLIVPLAALRFDLRLIWCATCACLLGYLWVSLGARPAGSEPIVVPGYYQLIMLLAIALSGVVLGQIVRRARQLILTLTSPVRHAAAERTA